MLFRLYFQSKVMHHFSNFHSFYEYFNLPYTVWCWMYQMAANTILHGPWYPESCHFPLNFTIDQGIGPVQKEWLCSVGDPNRKGVAVGKMGFDDVILELGLGRPILMSSPPYIKRLNPLTSSTISPTTTTTATTIVKPNDRSSAEYPPKVNVPYPQHHDTN